MEAKFKLEERDEIKAIFKVNAVLTDVTEIEEKIQANKELIEEETRNRINADTELQNSIDTKQDKGDYALNSRVDGVVNAFDNEIEVINTNIDTKQNKLVSGSNIKTINGESILGVGNIEIKGGGQSDIGLSIVDGVLCVTYEGV